MVNHVLRGIKDAAKRITHSAGGFHAYHALRNDRALTVLALHRVLPPSDPRSQDADPEWTISVDAFADLVAFARKHFNVVSLDEVLEARRRGSALPSRPILLTFDDGWADNAQHALPVLEAKNTPAVIFVAGDAIGMESMFWREGLRAASRGGRLDAEIWSSLWCKANANAKPPEMNEQTLEDLLSRLFELTRTERDTVLAPFRSRIEDGRRHMMTVEELRHVHSRGIAIGAHGRTHEPLPHCEDLDDELTQPRKRLGELLGVPVTTMALPHSRLTPEVLRRAARAGYELVFTGKQELTPTRIIPFTVGRLPIVPLALADESGCFRPERLALHLFRRPHLQAWA